MKMIEARQFFKAICGLLALVIVSEVLDSSTWADGTQEMPFASSNSPHNTGNTHDTGDKDNRNDDHDCGLGTKLAPSFPPEILEKITRNRRGRNPDTRILRPVPNGFSSEEILAELKALNREPFLDRNGYSIYLAKGSRIPKALDELGRLREITFRAVGEGTGNPRDIDENFDPYYYHLIAWDKKNDFISGAYRFALVPEIMATRGPTGLYLLDQFHISDSLLKHLQDNTIEVSRSFVRAESQRGLTLFFLLKAIAKYMVLNPRYRHLWGAVSISNEYSDISKILMTEFLAENYPHPESASVQPVTTPHFSTALTLSEIRALVGGTSSLDGLQDLVRFAENDAKVRIPPLIPIYIGIGVRFLGFNFDPSFNTVDGLILTDVPMLNPDVRSKLMEDKGNQTYMDYWAPRLNPRSK